MTSPIVINIHGAKLLSKELSKNARIHRMKKAKITRLHRSGANGAVAKRLSQENAHTAVPVAWYSTRPEIARWLVEPFFHVRSVVLTRICPVRHMADGDNASTLLSATRDGVADALGVNDKVFVDNPTELDIQNGKIAIRYEQIDGPWGVRITIEPR